MSASVVDPARQDSISGHTGRLAASPARNGHVNTPPLDPAVNRATMIRHLRELIQALDARTPQLERVGEVEIAREAATLKAKALARLAELEASS
jgi:hypothetical protein